MRSSAPRPTQAPRRRGSEKATASFAANGGPSRTAPAMLLRELQVTAAALRRPPAGAPGANRPRPRSNKRAGMHPRRARTRHLIELGGLVHKAGFVELTGDDRAALLGALIESADK